MPGEPEPCAGSERATTGAHTTPLSSGPLRTTACAPTVSPNFSASTRLTATSLRVGRETTLLQLERRALGRQRDRRTHRCFREAVPVAPSPGYTCTKRRAAPSAAATPSIPRTESTTSGGIWSCAPSPSNVVASTTASASPNATLGAATRAGRAASEPSASTSSPPPTTSPRTATMPTTIGPSFLRMPWPDATSAGSVAPPPGYVMGTSSLLRDSGRTNRFEQRRAW